MRLIGYLFILKPIHSESTLTPCKTSLEENSKETVRRDEQLLQETKCSADKVQLYFNIIFAADATANIQKQLVYAHSSGIYIRQY